MRGKMILGAVAILVAISLLSGPPPAIGPGDAFGGDSTVWKGRITEDLYGVAAYGELANAGTMTATMALERADWGDDFSLPLAFQFIGASGVDSATSLIQIRDPVSGDYTDIYTNANTGSNLTTAVPTKTGTLTRGGDSLKVTVTNPDATKGTILFWVLFPVNN